MGSQTWELTDPWQVNALVTEMSTAGMWSPQEAADWVLTPNAGNRVIQARRSPLLED